MQTNTNNTMDFNLDTIKHVHIIGIGGIGVSAIARLLKGDGKEVSGQDMNQSLITDELEKLGIHVSIGQKYEDIPEDTELIVYTIAIENYDKDLYDRLMNLKNDTNKKVAVYSYPQMLGIVSRDKYTIAVCGTHGKTTTTGMIYEILKSEGKSPSVIVGSLLSSKEHGKTNYIKGESDIFVVEACEYKRSFLNIKPDILVITNIEEDHLDYYKDIEDIRSAFRSLVGNIKDGGIVVCNPNDKNIVDAIKDTDKKVVDYNEYFDSNLKLKIPGIHNKKNAAAGIAVSIELGSSILSATSALSQFSGTWKRFEYKGDLTSGAKVYDDYAHHPSEIVATLQGFRELYKKEDGYRLHVVFQPHLFSRTKSLLSEFATSFTDADKVLVLPIYFAREVDDGSISSSILSDEINKNTDISKAFSSFTELEEYMKENKYKDHDIIITMGAGEAYKVGEYLLT